ncbi:MAG: InlB B-repeat-containing protein [Agathobacter sp.]|nr:InlB B-repeat-containing protein [Agathobacter sp.]
MREKVLKGILLFCVVVVIMGILPVKFYAVEKDNEEVTVTIQGTIFYKEGYRSERVRYSIKVDKGSTYREVIEQLEESGKFDELGKNQEHYQGLTFVKWNYNLGYDSNLNAYDLDDVVGGAYTIYAEAEYDKLPVRIQARYFTNNAKEMYEQIVFLDNGSTYGDVWNLPINTAEIIHTDKLGKAKGWTIAVLNDKRKKRIPMGENIQYDAYYEQQGMEVEISYINREGKFVRSERLYVLEKDSKYKELVELISEDISNIEHYKGIHFLEWKYDFGDLEESPIDFQSYFSVQAQYKESYSGGEFALTFHSEGGAISERAIYFQRNKSIGTLPTAEKPGYRFLGWFTEKIGGEKVTENSVFIMSDHLYAQWEKMPNMKYKIEYVLNGGQDNGENPNVYYSSTDTIILKKPIKKGYSFDGWYRNFNFITKVSKIMKGSAGNKILYAKWTANRYNIKFNGNGADSGSMKTLTNRKYGTSYTLKANSFKKKGYTFTGWNTKKDGSGKTYKNKASVKNLTSTDGKTITLYAQWKKTKYTITYVLQDGGKNNSKNPSYYYFTSSEIKLKNPTRKGYTFKGWYSDSKYKNKVTKIKKGSTGNKTFYAKWKANKYNIMFDGNGATSGKMTKLKARTYGKTYKLSANQFKKKGFTFAGWNTKADGSGKFYKDKESVKNLTSTNGKTVTLYAQWERTKYKISYELYGGINHSKNPETYTSVSAKITLKSAKREGYQFVAWHTSDKFTKKNIVKTIEKGSKGNKKFYAEWKANTYNIVFDGNGADSGSMKKMSSCKYDKSYTLSKNAFGKSGSEFLGWNTKADGSGTAYEDGANVMNLTTKNGGTVTLYAQWSNFIPRTTAPSFSDTYYNSTDNPFGTGNGTGNCTWYAFGRAYEILGEKPVFRENAKEWWKYREYYAGYSTDVNQPRVGAIVVWGSSNEYGHVAVIEEILPDGRIVCSESSYGGVWYSKYTKPQNTSLGTCNWYGNAVKHWGSIAMTAEQVLNQEDASKNKLGFIGYIYLK